MARTYNIVDTSGKYGASCQEKTVFTLTKDEVEYLLPLWESDREAFRKACRYMLNLYDIHSRWDGDRYEHFRFYLTPKHRLTVVHEWGYAV